jgi:hypothetical protein
VVSEQAAEGSDDAAAASFGNTLAGRITFIRDRSAVEDDEKLTPRGCPV